MRGPRATRRQASCGFSLILRISASATQWTLQFQRERQRKPFSQACKHPRDFSYAEGVKVFLLKRSQSSPSILRNMHGAAEAHPPGWEDATSSVGRSREYFAGGLSAARCFEAAGRGSTICNVDNLSLVAPQSVPLGGPPYFSPASVCPVVVERSWLNAAAICVTAQN